MVKVVINTQYGGFGLTESALEEYKKRKGITDDNLFDWEIPRDCPVLVSIVEEGGKDIEGDYADLKIVNIPEDVNWYVEEYDGIEWVAERHRTWR